MCHGGILMRISQFKAILLSQALTIIYLLKTTYTRHYSRLLDLIELRYVHSGKTWMDQQVS